MMFLLKIINIQAKIVKKVHISQKKFQKKIKIEGSYGNTGIRIFNFSDFLSQFWFYIYKSLRYIVNVPPAKTGDWG